MNKIMNDYNIEHGLAAEDNYMSDLDESDESSYLKNSELNKEFILNLHKLNYLTIDKTYKMNLLEKCLSDKKINRELLKYELINSIKYFQSENIKFTRIEFVKKALDLLKKYQCKAGGYFIEDDEWTIYKTDFKDEIVSENKLYLENSIDKNDAKDSDTFLFMERITLLLNALSKSINVSYKLKESKKDDLTWIYIMILFTSNKKK
jgi:hypothetical protein